MKFQTSGYYWIAVKQLPSSFTILNSACFRPRMMMVLSVSHYETNQSRTSANTSSIPTEENMMHSFTLFACRKWSNSMKWTYSDLKKNLMPNPL